MLVLIFLVILRNNRNEVKFEVATAEIAIDSIPVRVFELKPDSNEAYVGLGWICHSEGNLNEAEKLYNQALKIKPDDYPAKVHLLRMQKYEKAPPKDGGEDIVTMEHK